MKLEARLRDGADPPPTAWCRSLSEAEVAAGPHPVAGAVAVEEAVPEVEAEFEVVLVVLFIAAFAQLVVLLFYILDYFVGT